MRKYIIPLFLLICPTVASAIVISSNCDQYELCLDEVNANGDTYCNRPGCGEQIYNNESYCRKCTAGHFSSLGAQSPNFNANTCNGIDWLRTNLTCEKCKLDGKHDIETEISDALTWSAVAEDAINGATANANCGIDITCSAGQYYAQNDNKCTKCPSGTFSATTKVVTTTIGKIQTISSGDFCTTCGENATANDDRTDCNCNPGYQTSDQKTNDVGAANCVAIMYDVYYALNYNDPSRQQDPNGTISVTTPPYKLLDMQSGSVPDLTQTGYNFANKWQANKKLMTIEAGSPPKLLTTNDKISSGTEVYSHPEDLGDVTFVPIWTPKTFTVTYINGGETIDTSCTYENCQASDAPDNTDPTKYFAGWKCTFGCDDTTTLYQTDEDISKISDGNDMELTAQWETCPAGHYCINNTVNPCPAGSTSDAGKTQITECYINKETQFCDINGDNCFNIEDKNFKINYSVK